MSQLPDRTRGGGQGGRFLVVLTNARINSYILDTGEQHFDSQAPHRQQPGRPRVFCHSGELGDSKRFCRHG